MSYSTIIGVGNAGTIIGDDGGSWYRVRGPTTNDLYAIAYGDGEFVAGGGIEIDGEIAGGGVFLFSDDTGFVWQTALAPNINPDFDFVAQAITFGATGFVAFAAPLVIEANYPDDVFTSDTGTNWAWTAQTQPQNWIYGAAYGNGVFVAVGDAGSICVSSNAQNWLDVTGRHRSAIRAISCSPSLCIASAQPRSCCYPIISDFTTLVCTNGADWFVPSATVSPMSSVATSGKTFAGIAGGCIYTTTDGLAWSTNCIMMFSPNRVSGILSSFTAICLCWKIWPLKSFWKLRRRSCH